MFCIQPQNDAKKCFKNRNSFTKRKLTTHFVNSIVHKEKDVLKKCLTGVKGALTFLNGVVYMIKDNSS